MAALTSEQQQAVRRIKERGLMRFALTDLGNAERLVEQHGRDIRFVPGLGWHSWDGCRWRSDGDGEIMRRAKQTARGILAEAQNVEDDEERKKIVGWAFRSEAEARLNSCVSLAETEREVVTDPDDLDAAAGLLNVANGTVDLRTGKLREHDRADLITQLAPVIYNPATRSEEWERVLERACNGDDELREFLQTLAGYSATGEASEDILSFLHGPGATSKTTIIEAIRFALGDYAATADFETFLRQRGSRGATNDIARLRSKRLVISVEVDEGRELAEGLIKTVLGGDRVTARFLYRESFEFLPQFTLWLVANARPRVNANDDAIWRRIVQMPFVSVIPSEHRDPRLRQRLRSAENAQAILAWIVAGAVRYYADGLQVPESVRAYTAEYREENDALGDFIADKCELRPDAFTAAKFLRDAYEEWCRENSETQVETTAWGAALKNRGCTRDRLHGLRIWRGIELSSEGETTHA